MLTNVNIALCTGTRRWARARMYGYTRRQRRGGAPAEPVRRDGQPAQEGPHGHRVASARLGARAHRVRPAPGGRRRAGGRPRLLRHRHHTQSPQSPSSLATSRLRFRFHIHVHVHVHIHRLQQLERVLH